MLEEKYPQFWRNAEETAKNIKEKIEEGQTIRIISHFDADGISSAGIICTALYRLQASFHLTVVKQLTPEILEDLEEEKYTSIIFTDIGSGQLNLIEKHLKQKEKIIIIDHHPPIKADLDSLIHFNPHFHGIDGAKEISGSTTTYLVARALDKRNVDLSYLAIVGALGDRQDKGSQYSLIGVNKEVVDEAAERGILEAKKDIRLFGRETRPIHIALEYTTDPFIPELSGCREKCKSFIENEVKIPLKDENGKWRTISDLSTEEKQLLASKLIDYMIIKGLSAEEAQSIIGMVYIFLNEEKGSPLRDGREFATLLNACGRMGHPEIGVAICMGDRKDALEEATQILSKYREKLANSISWITQNLEQKLKEKNYVRYFHGEDIIEDNIIGTVTSLLLSSKKISNDKVVVGFAYSSEYPSMVKLSARTTQTLVNRGVDLGKALKLAAKKLGTEQLAGGHNIAAGGQIPRNMEEEFINHLDNILKEMLEPEQHEHTKQSSANS
ncbi:MAG: DHHA1 domain-containing protein [Candidatus Baldrarchaeota archaeon]